MHTLAFLYDLAPHRPILITLISTLAQYLATVSVIIIFETLLRRARQRVAGLTSLLPLALALVHTAVGHLVITGLTNEPDLALSRFLFWVIASLSWNPAVLYLVVQTRSRRTLLTEVERARRELQQEQKSYQRQQQAEHVALLTHLNVSTRPRLEHARAVLPHATDAPTIGLIAQELRTAEATLRTLVQPIEHPAPESTEMAAPPLWRNVVLKRVYHPTRTFALTQLLLGVVLCAFSIRPTGEPHLPAIVLSGAYSTAVFTLLDFLTRHGIATMIRRRLAAAATQLVLLGLFEAIATRAYGALDHHDLAARALVGAAAILVATTTLVDAGVNLANPDHRRRIALPRFARQCALFSIIQAGFLIVVIAPQRGEQVSALTLAGLTLLLSVPSGLLAASISSIATKNRQLQRARQHLACARESVHANRQRTRAELATLTHNPIQSRITSVAMGLDFALSGLIAPDDIRTRILSQLDSALAQIDALVETSQIEQARPTF